MHKLAKTVPVGDGNATVVVKEVTMQVVKEILLFLAELNEWMKTNASNEVEVINHFWNDALPIINRCIVYPESYGFEQLTGSEVTAVFEALLEVNRDFFSRTGVSQRIALIKKVLATVTVPLSEPLTTPVASSPNADISMSGNMDTLTSAQ